MMWSVQRLGYGLDDQRFETRREKAIFLLSESQADYEARPASYPTGDEVKEDGV